jgi:hypothetical protein
MCYSRGMNERERLTKAVEEAERELNAATNVRAATIVAIGYFIAGTGATTYAEAVQLRETTFDQAAAEIRAKVAQAMESRPDQSAA